MSRRAALAGAACAGAAAAVSLRTSPASAVVAGPVFRLGTLPLGTASWEADTIVRQGLDRAAGVRLEVVKLASNEAARIAFLSGAVDTIVSDLIFAARLRAEGKPIRFLPYSTAEGGLMVATGSPITSFEALRGRTIGVAGGPLDKGWILLRAAALARAGLDLQKDAKPVFGAPPLLASKLEKGEVEAALLYWNFCARLQAKGFTQLTSAQAITTALGVSGKVALLGYLVRDDEDPVAVKAFAAASRAAKASLSGQGGDAWTALRPLMEAPDQATFEALRKAFVEGIPKRPRAAELADAETLFALLVKLGGEPLVGAAKGLPAGLYVDPDIYG